MTRTRREMDYGAKFDLVLVCHPHYLKLIRQVLPISSYVHTKVVTEGTSITYCLILI